MNIKSVKIENFTVFDKITADFCEGINIFIGENATGKTHLLKVLYSACRSNRVDTDFGQKIVRTMLPDDFRIARLVNRRQGNHNARIKVCAVDGNAENEVQLGCYF